MGQQYVLLLMSEFSFSLRNNTGAFKKDSKVLLDCSYLCIELKAVPFSDARKTDISVTAFLFSNIFEKKMQEYR